jgi:hypothetical protein
LFAALKYSSLFDKANADFGHDNWSFIMCLEFMLNWTNTGPEGIIFRPMDLLTKDQ